MASVSVGAFLLAALAAVALPSSEPPPPTEPAPHPSALVFEEVPFQPPQAERRQLAAGTVVHLAPDRSLPLVELAIALRVGSFVEAADEVGLARLTAALLRRGGAGELDAEVLDQRLDLLGAELDTIGGERRSGLRLSVPSWELTRALDLAFDVLARPRLQTDRLEVLRSNLTESMGRRNQDPLEILQREWGRVLFADFYGTRAVTPQTLATITQATIRRFHRAYWRPEHLFVALSGDFDADAVVADLERRLAAWRQDADQPGERQEIAWPPPSPGTGRAAGLYVVRFDTPQAKVLFGHRLEAELDWVARERTALAVLQEILGGGGAVSRLGGRLRTAGGLVYRVWAEIEPGPQPPGFFRVFLETDPARTARAVELAVAEIERLQADLVHPRELEIVRRTLLHRLRGSFDTPEKIAGRHSESELLGRPADYWQQHLDQLATITREEVRKAARKYLQVQNLRFLVVTSELKLADAARLERAAGYPAIRLPSRDPLTLEAIPDSPE